MFDFAVLLINGSYLLAFLGVAAWEAAAPAYPRPHTRAQRWPANIALFLFNGLLLRFFTSAYITNFAYIAWKNHWGLLNWLDLDPRLSFFISLPLMDLAGYLFHRLFHRVPVLWKVHRLHHSDTSVDLTTSVRFHPLETLIASVFDLGATFLLGPSYIAVALLGILVFLSAFFSHANIRIWGPLDRMIRWFVPTPAVHRIHHSLDQEEAESNYAVLFVWWDRLLGTYREEPVGAYRSREMGVKGFESRADLALPRMMALPFLKEGPKDPLKG